MPAGRDGPDPPVALEVSHDWGAVLGSGLVWAVSGLSACFYLTLGGIIMELSPVSVSLSSLSSHRGHRLTFTCSYIASQRLDIEFSSSSSSSSSSPSSMVRREIMSDSVSRYSWGATRHWTIVVSPATSLVTCSLLSNQGVTVGQLHARIYTTGASLSLSLSLSSRLTKLKNSFSKFRLFSVLINY